MNITDQINALFNNGVTGLTFTKSEQGHNILTAEQKLPTKNGISQFRHQVGGDDWPVAIATVKEFVEHNTELQTKILRAN